MYSHFITVLSTSYCDAVRCFLTHLSPHRMNLKKVQDKNIEVKSIPR